MFSSLNKTAASAAPPYRGEISAETRLAVLQLAKADIPSDVLARLAKATVEIRRLNGDHDALSLEAVRAAHNVSRERTVDELLKGVELTGRHKHVDSIARDFSARRDAINEAKGRVFLSCVDDLEAVGELLHSAVIALAARVEKQERETAAAFHAPFSQSQQLAMIRTVAILVANRFADLRQNAKSYAANMGSPASFLGDLLPGAAEW